MKNIFICCDSFKGTLSSNEVNTIIRNGLKIGAYNSIVTKQLADGGEGSLSLLNQSIEHIDEIKVATFDPIGRPIEAMYLRKDHRAYIEIAQATGISLLDKSDQKPLELTSYGTGVLILHAIKNACTEIHLFLGGSATVDGGTGILAALNEAPIKADNLLFDFQSIDISISKAILNTIQFVLVCDVSNKSTGDKGAVNVFGPQKGANKMAVKRLESQMLKWTAQLNTFSEDDLNEVEGLGAAGAIGLPFYALSNTKIVTGFSYFNELLEYKKQIEKCDILITGEGCIDSQTLMGKGPGNIASLGEKLGKLVIGIGGIVKCKPPYFNVVFATSENSLQTEEHSVGAKERLADTVKLVLEYLNDLSS